MAQISARGSKGHHTFYLSVVESGTDIANNTSTVTVNFWFVDDNNWYFDGWGSRITYTYTINGVEYSGNVPDHNTKTTYIVQNQTIVIPHNSDGTKQLNFSFSISDSTSASYTSGSASASGTLTLTTIPRTSELTVNDYLIQNTSANNGLTYTITPKASFYHKVIWQLNGTTITNDITSAISTATSYSINNQVLLPILSNVASGTLIMTLETYSDSTLTTLIGSVNKSVTVTVDGDYIKPTVNLQGLRQGTRSEGVSSSITMAVAGYTTLQCPWNRTIPYGATGATTYFVINRVTPTPAQSTSASGTLTTSLLPPSSSDYIVTLRAYAIDSRGITSDVVTSAITVRGYQKPLAQITAYRTLASGEFKEDDVGEYAFIDYHVDIRSSVNNQNSIESVSCTYAGGVSGSITNPPQWVALAVNQYITVTLTVTDRVSSTTVNYTINVASFPLDLADDGAGAVGVGLGMTAELNMIRFGLNTHMYNDKYFIYHRVDNSTIALTNGQVLNSTRGSATSVSDLVTMASDVGTNIPFVCSPTIALSNTLSGYSQTGIFIGKKVDGADRIDYLILAGNGNALAYGSINTSNSSVSYKQVAITDDIYYKNGNTVNISGNMVLSGQVSGRVVSFFLPMEKRLTNISSVNITALTLTIRGVLGYINGMSAAGVDFTDSSYTKSISIRPGGLYFSITFGSAITNFTNNSPVAVYVQSLGVTLN